MLTARGRNRYFRTSSRRYTDFARVELRCPGISLSRGPYLARTENKLRGPDTRNFFSTPVPGSSGQFRAAISLFLVKTPHRDFSHAHFTVGRRWLLFISALPGDVTPRAMDNYHYRRAGFFNTSSKCCILFLFT